MSLTSEHIIPGNHGKIFGTDAIKRRDLEWIKERISVIDGVKEVIVNLDIYPREITVQTSKLVQIEDIEKKIMPTGFHVVPKDSFEIFP